MRALLVLLLCAGTAAAQNGVNQLSGPNVANQGAVFNGQQRFTGLSGGTSGIDVDGPGGANSGSIGILVEDDIAGNSSGIITNGSAGNLTGWGPSYIGADSKSQATLVLETHNATAGSDSVLALRRSRGTGHTTEGQIQSGDYLGTIMFQGWNGTAGVSWNGGYGQAMGLESYTSEAWDSTHRGTTTQFYDTLDLAGATAVTCTGSLAPLPCCTAAGAGNANGNTCNTIPSPVWGATQKGDFSVRNKLIIGSLGYMATTAPSSVWSLQTAGVSDFVSEGNSAREHPRHVVLAPGAVQISNSTAATTALSFSVGAVGAVMAGSCTAPGCPFVLDVTATAICTATGGNCTVIGQAIWAKKTFTCTNLNGTVSCGAATHYNNGGSDTFSWFADTLNSALTAQPITVSASSTNVSIQVVNPAASSSVYTWSVAATVDSGGV